MSARALDRIANSTERLAIEAAKVVKLSEARARRAGCKIPSRSRYRRPANLSDWRAIDLEEEVVRACRLASAESLRRLIEQFERAAEAAPEMVAALRAALDEREAMA